MNRTKFYHVAIVNGISELDFLWNSLSNFEMNYAPTYYRVSGPDLMRPDIISYKNYGTVNFWWIIMTVNDIDNPLTDLEEGMILTIPSKLDIFAFRKAYRVR